MTYYDDTMGVVNHETDRRNILRDMEEAKRQSVRRMRRARIHEWLNTGIQSASFIGLTAILGYYRSIGQLGDALFRPVALTLVSAATFLIGMQVGRDRSRK